MKRYCITFLLVGIYVYTHTHVYIMTGLKDNTTHDLIVPLFPSLKYSSESADSCVPCPVTFHPHH